MKRLGDSTPSNHLEHIFLYIFHEVEKLQKLLHKKPRHQWALYLSACSPATWHLQSSPLCHQLPWMELTEWMTNHHAIYWYVLYLFSENRLLFLNNHISVFSKNQNRLLVHQLTPNHQLRLIPLILCNSLDLAYSLVLASTVTIDQLVTLWRAKFLPGQLRSVALWIGQNHPERLRNRETEDWMVNVRDLKFVRFAFDLGKYCFKPQYVL